MPPALLIITAARGNGLSNNCLRPNIIAVEKYISTNEDPFSRRGSGGFGCETNRVVVRFQPSGSQLINCRGQFTNFKGAQVHSSSTSRSHAGLTSSLLRETKNLLRETKSLLRETQKSFEGDKKPFEGDKKSFEGDQPEIF